MHIFKVLLSQRAQVANLIERLNITSQATLTNSKQETMAGCLQLIDRNLALLGQKMFAERRHDPQELIRKAILEGIQSLEAAQLEQASHIPDLKLMQIVFESLREQSPQIRKLAVQILWQVLVKQGDQSSEVFDNAELVRLFKVQK
jgi:hypothetical protein